MFSIGGGLRVEVGPSGEDIEQFFVNRREEALFQFGLQVLHFFQKGIGLFVEVEGHILGLSDGLYIRLQRF